MISFFERFRIPVALLFFACQYFWMMSNASLLHWESFNLWTGLSLIFLTGFWLFLLLDIFNNRIFNKTFWLMSMLILPFIAPAVYLFQRKKLRHMRTSLFTKK